MECFVVTTQLHMVPPTNWGQTAYGRKRQEYRIAVENALTTSTTLQVGYTDVM